MSAIKRISTIAITTTARPGLRPSTTVRYYATAPTGGSSDTEGKTTSSTSYGGPPRDDPANAAQTRSRGQIALGLGGTVALTYWLLTRSSLGPPDSTPGEKAAQLSLPGEGNYPASSSPASRKQVPQRGIRPKANPIPADNREVADDPNKSAQPTAV